MRRHEMEIEIAAPAAEVWKAISTAQGIASWFAPCTAVEPGVGGKVFIKWGEGMEGTQRIEIWEPERQLRIGHDRGEPAPPSVVDYFIEGRGGTTVLRMVHSGFGEDANFDSEFDATGAAWPVFLKMMKHSVERGIAGCRNVTVFRMPSEPRETAWQKLSARMGGAVDGLVRHSDPRGYLCCEFPSKGGAMLAVFCENCGSVAAVTITWLLYDVAETEAERMRQEWTSLVDSAFATTAGA
jgi:uncharacterized protein YndB with AHSA1/START domain